MENNWTIQACADKNHPNRRRFVGVLTFLDVVSDKAPSGARGHRVILTTQAAKSSLHTLIGMAVDVSETWQIHDVKRKCGVITEAEISGNEVVVRGFLYGKDYPEVVSKLEKDDMSMGMSYELHEAHVTDMKANIWELNRCTFTGACILLRNSAAYRNTSFRLDEAA